MAFTPGKGASAAWLTSGSLIASNLAAACDRGISGSILRVGRNELLLISMHTERLAKLTEKQRICLRLVYQHRSSKEIARELGIGSDAVDQRLKTAMRRLGVESRVEAARLLVMHEGPTPYQPFVYQTPDVVPDRVSPSPARANTGARSGTEPLGIAVREEQAAFSAALPWQTSGLLSLPLPLAGGRRNGLGAWQRIGWIIAIAIGTAVAFGALLSGLEALAQLSQVAH